MNCAQQNIRGGELDTALETRVEVTLTTTSGEDLSLHDKGALRD